VTFNPNTSVIKPDLGIQGDEFFRRQTRLTKFSRRGLLKLSAHLVGLFSGNLFCTSQIIVHGCQYHSLFTCLAGRAACSMSPS